MSPTLTIKPIFPDSKPPRKTIPKEWKADAIKRGLDKLGGK